MAKPKVEETPIAPVETVEATEVKITSVTFYLRSGRQRVFTEATHGKDFLETAGEFEKNNASETMENRNRIDNVISKHIV